MRSVRDGPCSSCESKCTYFGPVGVDGTDLARVSRVPVGLIPGGGTTVSEEKSDRDDLSDDRTSSPLFFRIIGDAPRAPGGRSDPAPAPPSLDVCIAGLGSGAVGTTADVVVSARSDDIRRNGAGQLGCGSPSGQDVMSGRPIDGDDGDVSRGPSNRFRRCRRAVGPEASCNASLGSSDPSVEPESSSRVTPGFANGVGKPIASPLAIAWPVRSIGPSPGLAG